MAKKVRVFRVTTNKGVFTGSLNELSVQLQVPYGTMTSLLNNRRPGETVQYHDVLIIYDHEAISSQSLYLQSRTIDIEGIGEYTFRLNKDLAKKLGISEYKAKTIVEKLKYPQTEYPFTLHGYTILSSKLIDPLADESVEWRDVPGFNGEYKANRMGDIFSVRSGRVLNGYIDVVDRRRGSGTWVIRLVGPDSKQHCYSIDTLIALTFIPNPLNFVTVTHKDGDPLNNNVENLEWSTVYEHENHNYIQLSKTKTIYHIEASDGKVYSIPGLKTAANFIGCSTSVVSARTGTCAVSGIKGSNIEVKKIWADVPDFIKNRKMLNVQKVTFTVEGKTKELFFFSRAVAASYFGVPTYTLTNFIVRKKSKATVVKTSKGVIIDIETVPRSKVTTMVISE